LRDVDSICDIAVYSGSHGMKQEVALDEACEPVLFFDLIDSEPIRKNGRTNQSMCQTKSS
jgi:hypothetical protein